MRSEEKRALGIMVVLEEERESSVLWGLWGGVLGVVVVVGKES
jgi:hypothetical protein